MWYQIKDLQAKIKRRASLLKCERCGFFYPKTEKTCYHCRNMTDEEVLRQLARKKQFRLSLGNGMLLGAALILIIMFLI